MTVPAARPEGRPLAVLCVIAGPSGVGKGTIVDALRARHPELWYSVSATTREPRPGEADGRDYHFLDRGEFERRAEAGEFLEYFEVYGELKGTPKVPISQRLDAGDDVLLELDVQGALAVRASFPDALLIFVRPPSRSDQRARLEARGHDAPDDLERRLAEADAEEAHVDAFDAVVVNDDVDRATAEIAGILAARRSRPDEPGS
ncbi:MAG: guanylate kinase [Acidimicrobiia bacterium]